MTPVYLSTSESREDGSMPERVRVVVLCEDGFHRQFASAFLNRLGIDSQHDRRITVCGSKSKLFQQFPSELKSLRNPTERKWLLVLVDGDELSYGEILARLKQESVQV